jgi:GNAT superfamily N-acetyltransferase
LRVEDGLAWLGGGAVRTPWRRRGIHQALILARLRRAARQGCRWAWVETAEPHTGRPDGSRRNLLRLGFEEIGTEPSYVLHLK